MKYIAVNRFYRPDSSATAQLLTDLAENLAASGKKIVIITSRLCYNNPNRLPEREALAGVEIHRVWTSSFGRKNLLGRSVDYTTFYWSAFWEMLRVVARDDVLIAKTDPPLISVPAAIVAKLKGAKLVNWCQDLFPEVAAALGMKWAAGLIGNFLRILRNWSLRSAVFNAALHERMSERLLLESIPSEKIRILPNWADVNIQPVEVEQNTLRREWGLEGKFVIGYSGNLGRAHMPDKVAGLVVKTSDIQNIVWLFIGSGAGMQQVKNAAAGMSNVVFKPYQPLERLSESLSLPDMHLISLEPACEGLIVPSKLYGVLSVGRPILFLGALDGAVAREMAGHGGIVLDQDRPEDWHTNIVALRSKHPGPSVLENQFPSKWKNSRTAPLAIERWRRALEELEQQQRCP